MGSGGNNDVAYSTAHLNPRQVEGTPVEFSGLIKGKLLGWFFTSPARAILNWKMGNPDPRMMELLALQGGETVVDFGSGSGHHSMMVAKELTAGSGKVIACDVSTEMIDRLKVLSAKRGVADRIDTRVEDALNLSSVATGSADCSISVATWHHVHGDLSILDKICAEMVRVLKPGGRFCVCDVGIDTKLAHDRALGKAVKAHSRPFGINDMESIMAKGGLKDRKVEKVGRWVIGFGVK